MATFLRLGVSGRHLWLLCGLLLVGGESLAVTDESLRRDLNQVIRENRRKK